MRDFQRKRIMCWYISKMQIPAMKSIYLCDKMKPMKIVD